MRIDLDAAGVERCLADAGIGVHVRAGLPSGHGPRGAGPPRAPRPDRRSTSSGPLTNPARPYAQVVGVSDERMLPLMAEVLARRGVAREALPGRGRPRRAHDHGPVARSSTSSDGEVRETHLDPTRARARAGRARAICAGATPPSRRRIARAVLDGRAGPAARRRPAERRRRARGRRVRGRPRRRAWPPPAASIDDGRRGGDARPLGRGLQRRPDAVASRADDPVRPHDPRGDRGRPHRDRPVRSGVRPAVVGGPARRRGVPRVRELPVPLHRREAGAARPHRARRDRSPTSRSSCIRASSSWVRRSSASRCPTTSSRGSRASPRSAASAC